MRDIVITLLSSLPLFAVACRAPITDTADTADTHDTADTADTADTGAYVPAAKGSATVCVSRDFGEAWGFDGVYTGTVVVEAEGYTPLPQAGCYAATPARSLLVVTAEGQVAVGWTVAGPDGDVTPELGLQPGALVDLHVASQCGEGCGYAFSVVRDDVIVGAVADGYWGEALDASATPGLTVSAGAELGQYEDNCGTVADHSMIFAGDTTVELTPFATADLDVGTAALTVYALGAETWVHAVCTDLPDRFSWAVAPR